MKSFGNFCKNFKTKISTTPAKSPWRNGICEQHDAILIEILLKVKNDINSGILLLHGLVMLKIISLMLADFVAITMIISVNKSSKS